MINGFKVECVGVLGVYCSLGCNLDKVLLKSLVRLYNPCLVYFLCSLYKLCNFSYMLQSKKSLGDFCKLGSSFRWLCRLGSLSVQ